MGEVVVQQGRDNISSIQTHLIFSSQKGINLHVVDDWRRLLRISSHIFLS